MHVNKENYSIKKVLRLGKEKQALRCRSVLVKLNNDDEKYTVIKNKYKPPVSKLHWNGVVAPLISP